MWRGSVFVLFVFSFFVHAFDLSSKSNVVLYWGQEGGTLASVCADPGVDVVAMAFLTTFFGTGGLPVINFAGSCNGPTFPGTDLLQCPEIGQDIKTCQESGKAVLLSLGGAIGNYGFSSASEAQTFATTLWNLFGEGTSSTRPFGSSVVDGFDLDIENNQPEFYSDFITAMRKLFSTGTKQYYITGAPQCPFPDASLGKALDSSPFDMVFVQFYNNPPCGVESSSFNFDTWQGWASSAPNSNVKVFVGVPGSTAAAGSGYITPDALESIVASVAGHNNFGGVMMWDATQAFNNVRGGVNYARSAKNALVSNGGNNTQSPASPANQPRPVTVGTSGSSTQAQAPTTLQTITQQTVSVSNSQPAADAGTGDPGTVTSVSTQVQASIAPAAAPTSTSPESCSLGTIDCINGQFAQCVNGEFVFTSCPVGTTCTKIPIDDNNFVVTCDFPGSSKPRRMGKRHGHGHKHVLMNAGS